jgi:hypothetical protein
MVGALMAGGAASCAMGVVMLSIAERYGRVLMVKRF